MAPYPDRPARDRAGFTLIELLVALVIGGLVTSTIFQLLQGQGRFVELQRAREEVQQNARAVVDLVGSELRAVPPGDGLVRAFADSVTIRVPRAWGTVCSAPATGATSLDVAVVGRTSLSTTVNLGTGVAINVADPDEAAAWTPAAAVTGVSAAGTTCGGRTLPGAAQRRTLTVAAVPTGAGSRTNTPRVGDVVYLFDQVTYRTGSSSASSGRWIQRRLGDASTSSNQPLAGPVRDDSSSTPGLKFYYYAGSSGAALNASTGLTAAQRLTVRRIRMVVHTLSNAEFNQEPQEQADSLVVTLRNRN